jgi:predicted 3-demethylubiquinone-9 3-methyltransferase (glyoxalase superfamily)
MLLFLPNLSHEFSAMKNIHTCLWFDDQGEEAAKFYTLIFPNSRINHVSRYGEAGKEHHRKPVGSVMVVAFELNGHKFTALNGGPQFKFNEAISFQIMCESLEEVDYYWEKLSEGGDPKAQACGWLKDRFGVSWQVIPIKALELISSPDEGQAQRAMGAMMQMKKLDVATMQRAADQA